MMDTQLLWSVSDFEATRRKVAANPTLRRQTVLSTTFQAELGVLERRRESSDALEVLSTCLRLREAALIHLQYDEQVWPVTVFPHEALYHSPRPLLQADRRELAGLRVLDLEPPGVRAPGHWMHERVAEATLYHPLRPMLWRLALDGPRAVPLHEVTGSTSYRVVGHPGKQGLPTPGALGPTIERLRKESAPLREIARWPGMSYERASRLINALYLTSNLIVSRAHPSARPGVLQSLLGRFGR